MPYGMPHILAKGPVLRKLELWLNQKRTTDAGQQEIIDKVFKKLEAVDYGEQMADLLNGIGVTTLGSAYDKHVRQHWYNWNNTGGGAWWNKHQPIEPLSKYGLWYALKRNVDRGVGKEWLPWAFYWICQQDMQRGKRSGLFWKDRQSFMCSVNESPDQLTVLIFTPPEPKGAKPTLNYAEKMYIVRPTGMSSGYGEQNPDGGAAMTRSFASESPTPDPDDAEIIELLGLPN